MRIIGLSSESGVDASRATSWAEVSVLSFHDLLIIRTAKKKDHRELQIIEGGFARMQTGINLKDIVEVTLTPTDGQTFTPTPKMMWLAVSARRRFAGRMDWPDTTSA